MSIMRFLPLLLVGLSQLLAANKPNGDKPSPPNFIFILSDDIAQGDMGIYGQKLIQTPTLDRPLWRH